MLTVYNSASKRSLPIAPPAATSSSDWKEAGAPWTFDRSADGKITGIANGAGPNRRVLGRQP